MIYYEQTFKYFRSKGYESSWHLLTMTWTWLIIVIIKTITQNKAKKTQLCLYFDIPGTVSIPENHIFKACFNYSSLCTGEAFMPSFTYLFAYLKMPENTLVKYTLYQKFIGFIKWQVVLNFVSKKETWEVFHIKGFIPLWYKNVNYLLLLKKNLWSLFPLIISPRSRSSLLFIIVNAVDILKFISMGLR